MPDVYITGKSFELKEYFNTFDPCQISEFFNVFETIDGMCAESQFMRGIVNVSEETGTVIVSIETSSTNVILLKDKDEVRTINISKIFN